MLKSEWHHGIKSKSLWLILPRQATKMTAPDFAEGGLRAWLVVVGCWCISFTSFGIVNTFGQVPFAVSARPRH